jgi:hypothetical protein
MNITKQIKNIEPVVEWATARTAARRLEGILTDEITYLTEGNKLQNVYSPIAWVRLCRTISTLTAGMVSMRMTFEGKSTPEIAAATGIRSGSIAAFKAWNTMYARDVQKMLAAKGKTEEQRNRDLEFLNSIGVTI